MNIESQTGKAPKKGKNVGRRKKNKKDDELRQNVYYEIILDKYKSKNLEEAIKKIKRFNIR